MLICFQTENRLQLVGCYKRFKVIFRRFKQRYIVLMSDYLNLKFVKNPMAVRHTEVQKIKVANDDFNEKNQKFNIKKVYKIKNSNIKKLMEFQKSKELK